MFTLVLKEGKIRWKKQQLQIKLNINLKFIILKNLLLKL